VSRVARGVERTWKALLAGAIGALVAAAIATLCGADAFSRSAGTVAWAAAALGSTLGLVTGAGRASRDRPTEVQR
jgi:hypothetical protein